MISHIYAYIYDFVIYIRPYIVIIIESRQKEKDTANIKKMYTYFYMI